MQENETVMRLAKPKKKGLLTLVFSRLLLMALLIAAQVMLYVVFFAWLQQYLPHYAALQIVFTLLMMLYLFNSRMDYAAKLTWLAVIAVAPFLGTILLAYTQTNIGHRATRKRTAELIAQTKDAVPQDAAVLERLKGDPYGTDDLHHYLNRSGDFPIFDRTELFAPTVHAQAEGYVMPFGDCPLDEDKAGEAVYMDMLNRATNYVYIMTPYLILDGELNAALKFAAQRGVDVKLILPGIPDKKLAYALAKSHYAELTDAGVKIYEYAPGFVHAKVFVSDGCRAVVGTINLDYRSLYHHFECATYLYRVPCIADIARDFNDTLMECRAVTPESIKKEKPGYRIAGSLLKIIAPLM